MAVCTDGWTDGWTDLCLETQRREDQVSHQHHGQGPEPRSAAPRPQTLPCEGLGRLVWDPGGEEQAGRPGMRFEVNSLPPTTKSNSCPCWKPRGNAASLGSPRPV